MSATTAEKQRARARQDERAAALAAAGAPVGKKERSGTTGLAHIANELLPREWEDIRHLAKRVGFMEALVASGSAQPTSFTVQLQVLPAYAHTALDLVQRSNQGVICLVAFQVPWSAFMDEKDGEDAEDGADEWGADDWTTEP